MRITIVLPALFCGGVERIVAAMANNWAARDCIVTIFTFDEGAIPPFYALHPQIQHRPLALRQDSANWWQALRNNWRRLRALRIAIRGSKPDVVISFIVRANVRTLLALLGERLPVIVAERADPQVENPGWIWSWLRRLIYRRAACVVTHTTTAASFLRDHLRRDVMVIPNPVAAVMPLEPRDYSAVRQLIAIGRLAPEKGFDLLMKAFAPLAKKYPDLQLTIWGEGQQRTELEQLRDALHLQARIALPGVTTDVALVYTTADLFVQTSRFEGFGNALCEAMAYGLPVIASACIGPREIVADGVDGMLIPVEDVSACTLAIETLIADGALRRRLGQQATLAVKRYAAEQIFAQWDQVLREVTTPR